MISYAQNAEDVRLDRVFATKTDGFYIDVGAAHPVHDSVTRHFYGRGWRGINVEPTAALFDLLRTKRGRDINLQLALSNREGAMALWEPSSLPTWSTLSAARAETLRQTDPAGVERAVPVTTLARVCERHVRRTIDFLKIDVEGHEREVLEGADWHRWRPRVVVVEATEPGTTIPNHDQWEHLLVEAEYLFAAFDGLNRFYVSSEERGLIPALSTPVNVLDDYTPYRFLAQLDVVRGRTGRTLTVGPVALTVGLKVKWVGRRSQGRPAMLSRPLRLLQELSSRARRPS